MGEAVILCRKIALSSFRRRRSHEIVHCSRKGDLSKA